MSNPQSAGFIFPRVLVPNQEVNLKKWACVACDQFTSQPSYWDEVYKYIGASPSAAKITLPEVYLESDDVADRIAEMKQTMRTYLNDGIVEALPEGVVFIERYAGGKIRRGILLAIDLEQYSADIDESPLVRPTEQTVFTRVPPRAAIRRGALLEAPHALLLIDDENDSVIGALNSKKDAFTKIYDFPLMMEGGRLIGRLAAGERAIKQTRDALMSLPKRDGMLFCVGDGNHSLAAAKAVWDEVKATLPEREKTDHPARFAMCEVVNLRDPAIEFMPIHRVLFNVNPADCAHHIASNLRAKGLDIKLVFGRFHSEPNGGAGEFIIPFRYHDGAGKLIIERGNAALGIAVLQAAIDEFLDAHPQAGIDYIHGDDAFKELTNEYDRIGFYMEPIKKEDFFRLLKVCGVFPRKSFSMGEAKDKRYYMESRLLKRADYEPITDAQPTTGRKL